VLHGGHALGGEGWHEWRGDGEHVALEGALELGPHGGLWHDALLVPEHLAPWGSHGHLDVLAHHDKLAILASDEDLAGVHDGLKWESAGHGDALHALHLGHLGDELAGLEHWCGLLEWNLNDQKTAKSDEARELAVLSVGWELEHLLELLAHVVALGVDLELLLGEDDEAVHFGLPLALDALGHEAAHIHADAVLHGDLAGGWHGAWHGLHKLGLDEPVEHVWLLHAHEVIELVERVEHHLPRWHAPLWHHWHGVAGGVAGGVGWHAPWWHHHHGLHWWHHHGWHHHGAWHKVAWKHVGCWHHFEI